MPISSADIRGRFATTNWSLVRRLEGPEGASALAGLCEQYWFPLYAYARRRLGSDHDARDSTQAFFAWMLEKNLLRRAAPERGRLRSFLLTSLQNFLNNEYQASRRQVRGGNSTIVSLDFQAGESQFAKLASSRRVKRRLRWTAHYKGHTIVFDGGGALAERLYLDDGLVQQGGVGLKMEIRTTIKAGEGIGDEIVVWYDARLFSCRCRIVAEEKA